MWYLIELKTNKRFYLLLNKPMYTVSRSADLGDLVLAGDASISRTHATLHPDRDHVKLVDTGSKYGTFVNGNLDTNVPMAKNAPVELREHDKIRFGRLEGVWRLERLVINALSTTLTVEQKLAVKQNLTTLNGTLLTDWTNQCTHLTVAEVTITMKVLHALAGTVPIVTPAYWTACITAAVAGAAELPDVDDYRPAIVENYIPAGISIVPNAERRRLFVHKEFVFMLPRHQERYELCIRLAGGRCSSLDRKRVARRTLLKPQVCVVQYNPSTQSQTTDDMGQVSRFLHEHQLRTIPESEIGMALLHCSTRKYCNPAFRVDAEFVELQGLVQRTPSAVLAAASEAQREEGTMNSHEHIEVAETKPPEETEESSINVLPAVEVAPVSRTMFSERRSLNVAASTVVGSNIYDSVGTASLKRAASPVQPESDLIANEPRPKRNRPSVASDDRFDESPKTAIDSDSNLLMPMPERIDTMTQPASRELPQNSITLSTTSSSSQSNLNSSGFLPRIRQTTNLHSQKAAATKPVPVSVPAATSASRKRAHQRLLANSDDSDDNDDAADENAPNLFQFNAGPALPKRIRRSDNTESLADSQPTSSITVTARSKPKQAQQQQNVSHDTSVGSVVMWRDSGAELYPNRRCASHLNLTVPCLQISLLTGWLSKSSIKCEPKDELDGDESAAAERKPALTADGRIANASTNGGGGGELLETASRLRIVSRVANGSAAHENGERKNFKAFTKKNNYRVQTRILKMVPAVPSAANMFDF